MRATKWWLLLLVIVPALIILPNVNDFAYPLNSPFTDLAISHFPNAVYIHELIFKWGEVPLWSDAIMSGYPFAADHFRVFGILQTGWQIFSRRLLRSTC